MANYRMPHDDVRCPDHDFPKRDAFPITVLNCGTGTGGSFPILANESNSLSFTPQVMGTVNIDTSDLKNITKKIEFSSIINFQTREFEEDFFIILVFQLSAVCNGGYKVPLGTWTYEKNLVFDDNGDEQTWTFKDPFCFTWCECDECPECCRFVVEVVDFRYDSIASASVSNVGISAMAVGIPCYK